MSDSVGARLRQARELRRITLEQASESTKVRTHYLQALESDDYSAIPSAAQARGFLRIYAEFLQLDVAQLLPAMQPAPVLTAPEVPASAAPAGPRPSLWSSLRDRLTRRSGKEPEVASFPTGLAPESTEQQTARPASLAASSDAETTPRAHPAAADVKKKAAK